MNKSYVFLADGFEEIEAIATVDILRRAGMEVNTVSINDGKTAIGAHGVPVQADYLIDDVKECAAEWLICPGGMPGASNLAACDTLVNMLTRHHASGGRLAAICASPAFVFGAIGLLEGVNATCYPGCEGAAPDVKFSESPIEISEQIITGRGPGYTMQFALAIIEATLGTEAADKVADGLLLTE